MIYEFRYFFDAGSGTCLWSASDPTKARFGYPVDHGKLPISQNLKFKIDQVNVWYDTSVHWDDPSGSSPWPEEEGLQFGKEAAELLNSLREELGKHFEITDERNRDESIVG